MTDERRYRDLAIVLRGRPFGEADRIVTLMTRDHGKIDAVAKGVRRPKTKLSGLLELASEVEIECHRGRNLDVIADATMRVAHWQALLIPDRYAVMTAVLESLELCTERHDPQPEVFELLRAMLGALTRLPDPMSLLPRFELRLLDLAGYAAEFSQCVRCGRALNDERAQILVAEGGAVCLQCDRYQPIDTAFSASELQALTQAGRALGGDLPLRLRLYGRLAGVVHRLFIEQVGRTPRGESTLLALLELDTILSERSDNGEAGDGGRI